ncbi:MAG: hypothetical protein KF845_15590 [Cyclobacteriaceae bacterium]|nr:hypothetical protein [Cyclobacteriaceae bacterium]
MNTVLARIISIVFHPLLITTYLFALLAFMFPASLYPITPGSRNSFIVSVFLITFLLPVINIWLFKLLGVVKSMTMEDRADRVKPFLLITVIYGVLTWMLYARSNFSIGDNLFNLLLIIDALILFSFIITLFYKASVHSIGIWGAIGILLPLNRVIEDHSIFIATLVALVLAGLVMSARLQLNAHTPREVLVGALAGFSIGFFGMLILF